MIQTLGSKQSNYAAYAILTCAQQCAGIDTGDALTDAAQ
jgi:hypothetical protein